MPALSGSVGFQTGEIFWQHTLGQLSLHYVDEVAFTGLVTHTSSIYGLLRGIH